MIQQGTILNVEVETLGSELASAAILGATVLTVRSTIDFKDTGGTLELGGNEYSYNAGAVDDSTGNIALNGPGIGIAGAEGDFVYVSPGPIKRYWAHVQVDGDDDDVIIAELSRAMAMSLVKGARDLADQETSAILEEKDGTWTVIDVQGLDLYLVGTAIYVPDLESPNFSVDEDGHLTAKTVVIESEGVTGAIPLIIRDDFATGDDWTQWWDSGGGIKAWVDSVGAIYSRNEMGIPVSHTNPQLMVGFFDNGVVWSDSSTGYGDAVLYWSAGHQITLTDFTDTIGADLEWGGHNGAGAGTSVLTKFDTIIMARRTTRPARVTGKAIIYFYDTGVGVPTTKELTCRGPNTGDIVMASVT